MKILILALSGIGDAIMFSPALRLLRKRYPDAQIDLLAMFKGVEELYKRNPHVNNVYFWNFLEENPLSTLRYVIGLHTRRYDISINVYPSNRWHYNVVSFFIGAKKRLGHDYNHTNLQSLSFLNNLRIHEDDRKHNVEENVALLGKIDTRTDAPIPPFDIFLSREDNAIAEQWIAQNKLDTKRPIIGYHTGSSLLKNHAMRRWAPEKFARLGLKLMKEQNANVLLFGGPDEYELNEQINAQMNNLGIVVKAPTLMASVALMKHCNAFVVNDSGLMHIAAGLQLPIVTIFAYTNPAYVYPWGTKYIMIRRDLECSPCFYYSPKPATCKWNEDAFRCITAIEVEEVYAAVLSVLGTSSPS